MDAHTAWKPARLTNRNLYPTSPSFSWKQAISTSSRPPLVEGGRAIGDEELVFCSCIAEANSRASVIHHTDCGMLTFSDDEFRRRIQDETGIKPEWAAETFPDVEEDVRQSIARIKASPFIPRKNVRGFMYEVESGRLREVV
jgi:hypothetical protein